MSSEKLEARIREVCQKALQKAVPSEKETRETLKFSEKISKRLDKELEKSGIEAQVQLEGSIAKDTWLAGEKDIDLFILLPKAYKREGFVKVLDIAKKVAGENYLEAYAEHPYVEAKIEGFTVDFVPCFKVESAEEVASSVDRTPLHTLYVKSQFDLEAKNQVRLLKRFMRGIDTYGAEIKVGGFSGYLCELLTLYYESFAKLLKAASNWRKVEVIDINGYYRGREDEAQRIFQEPLIVVDPVDKGRNVASAVRIDKLNEFVAASREFLEQPSLNFFYPNEVKALSVSELAQTMSSRGSAFIFLKTGVVRAVPDVLWGQLYKSQKALAKMIRQYGFVLIRDDVWSDEEKSNIFIFELHSRFLPAVERHIGPPIEKREDCEMFLKKYSGSKEVLSGPRIEGNRWVIERRRRYTEIVNLLKDKLKDGGESIGIASLISQAFRSYLEVWVDDEVKDFYSKSIDFASFLTEHLEGRARWLQ